MMQCVMHIQRLRLSEKETSIYCTRQINVLRGKTLQFSHFVRKFPLESIAACVWYMMALMVYTAKIFQ